MVSAVLYEATVAHRRPIDPPLTFTHRLALWCVDLDDPAPLPRWLQPFARFDARDHFRAGEPGTIRHKLDGWLAERGVDLAGGRVLMLASARLLGHVFDPLTVYWCHRPGGEPACVVAEVHNTYRGRHAYLLFPEEGRAGTPKEFSVSPFQADGGGYRMRLPVPDALLSLSVGLRQGGVTTLAATLRGVRRRVTLVRVLRMVLTGPLVPHRVSLLIRRHGVALWLRRAPRPVLAARAGGLHG
ncbi:DUF1365 domain-containing protein [Amycolatopsis suaedae]|uniref:DUF1365 domain-containing protein n=1 Tax=Amycolatopsis suaedae TaxID=2510978 RepID=A0A4V2ELZ5_9PSEU|nr:DUF1365 domain-containing protein [Amycolatopsis suaedae]RZQ63285.1 DUF1365 domain-containing protein [Amycolatopsis suaedae]